MGPGTHVGVVVFRCPEPDLTTVEIDLTDVYENKQSLIDDIESLVQPGVGNGEREYSSELPCVEEGKKELD